MADRDPIEAKAFLYKQILDLCYDKKDGLYYFCKFIVGDLKDIGYPSPFRYNSLINKWDKLLKRHKKLAILCARGHGKKIADSVPVLTTDGWKTHGELIIGNKVYNHFGKAIEVLDVNEKSTINYLLTTKNGKSIRCHENHEWAVFDAKSRTSKIIETKEMLNNTKWLKTRSRFFLPNIRPLEFDEKELSIDPYYLGLWLGDGCGISTTISHSPDDMESIDSIKYELSARHIHKDTGVVYSSYAKNGILQQFKKLKLFKNKHIPKIYKHSSIKQRLELIAGLIDSDGSVSKETHKIRIVNTNKKIIDGCVEILRTLGLRPYVTIQKPGKEHKYNGSIIKGKKDVYTIGFVSNIDIPTRLPRKKVNLTKLNRIAITDVKYEPNGEKGNCIMVDSDDGLYLVGKQLIPTHNSVFFSEILNIYDMFLFTHRRIIVESSNQEQASRIIDEIMNIIENNEWLKTKKNKDMWSTTKLGYNGGYILGKGFGSEILGEHVDRIVVDDILRSDNKLSDQEIEDFIDLVLDPILLNRRGQMIIVGTPKSETDVFSTIKRRVLEGSIWRLAKFPAIIDYENKILQCGDRFTWNDIMDKRLSMGSMKFAREYQLETFSRDTSLFPKGILDPAAEKGKDIPLLFKIDNRGPEWQYVVGVDVARSGSVSADYSVAVVLAYNSITQVKQVVHMWRSKGLKITEQAEQLARLSQAFNYPMFVVEQNNMGQDMIDSLVDDWNVFVEPFVTGGKGQKKDELIRFLITSFEHEQMIIPQRSEDTRKTMKILLDELSRFCVSVTPAGNERFAGVGAHDDTVMALALANKGTQIGGAPFAVAQSRSDFNNGAEPDPYSAFTQARGTQHETDLVRKIRMGIIR